MFHTYVKASSGAKIDIDRARYLMDDALFYEAERDIVKMMTPCGFNPFDIAVAKRMNPPETCGTTTAACIRKNTGRRLSPTSIPIGISSRLIDHWESRSTPHAGRQCCGLRKPSARIEAVD